MASTYTLLHICVINLKKNLPQAAERIHLMLGFVENTYKTAKDISIPSANIRKNTTRYMYCNNTATAVQKPYWTITMFKYNE
jgi:hypothetical protein